MALSYCFLWEYYTGFEQNCKDLKMLSYRKKAGKEKIIRSFLVGKKEPAEAGLRL
jgi:hypothetical protein